MATFSIIIPTLGRSSSYEVCKESLYKQTNQDFEIIKVTEEGSLAALRNEGARRARGQYLIFIDDDVVTSPYWLESIECSFRRGYAGVSGPSFISRHFRKNRDCFRLPTWLFSGKVPGTISPWGQWSLEATKETCKYEGEVDYLEACNMAFEKKAFWEVDGFDERFRGIGDWSEPDLCFRIRALGKKLWFARDAILEHRPSQSGAYNTRLVKCNRMENYELFSSRWIKPTLRHSLYKMILRTYFNLKEHGLC
jgi:GT2 family glycosyltransferase